jgi:NADPH-dependent 2,4-dienoyl-CoA reductase/sulfur reductase-like enzyme
VGRKVTTSGGSYGYDYLVIATGYRNKFDVVPGLGPDGYAQTITTLDDAERAGTAWAKFLDDPGPVVIGATQGASCFGAAYEFLFNTSHQLRKAKLHGKVPLTIIPAPPPAPGRAGAKSEVRGRRGRCGAGCPGSGRRGTDSRRRP